jgi:hypothetical protein
VDQEISDVSAHLRRQRSKTVPMSLLSQLRALPQIWGLSGQGSVWLPDGWNPKRTTSLGAATPS